MENAASTGDTIDERPRSRRDPAANSIVDEMVRRWEEGHRRPLEEYLARVPEGMPEAQVELIRTEIWLRRQAGETVRSGDYTPRFPHLLGPIVRLCDGQDEPTHAATTEGQRDVADSEDETREYTRETRRPVGEEQPHPTTIGRFRIISMIGKGSFGQVYLGHDADLDRPVAIKVPKSQKMSGPEDVEAYLNEARTLAKLDHPGIVPVLEVGRGEAGSCFVVSKYIAGVDLAQAIKRDGPFNPARAAGLVAEVALALDYTHSRDIVHRDVKPANILLDAEGKPYLADFGLALKDEDYGTGSGYAGTPAYMSPEQARGEGHRVDGRSDLFSLGVVLYEVLTGDRPFRGDSGSHLLDEIAGGEPRPPRQFDPEIPAELERICLKALSKRLVDRYATGRAMADDLRAYLGSPDARTGPEDTPGVDSLPIRIVPKGLRSFDQNDASFYLELLPGPRDRDGLPDSIRFWKAQVEQREPDRAFRVGLIYGPSGCGKSSMVKAGLLPRLARDVIAIHVEATANETEARLLNGLRHRCPGLAAQSSLRDAITAIRRGRGVPAGQKVLLVVDQLEQWLHARKEERNPELVQALRQCDGVRVQCLVLVRDDFWMAATGFMKDLEVPLVEGENSAAVDLFPTRHAEKVLRAFGRAFGVLPEPGLGPDADQERFLNVAVADLAEEGKVISVRLALFAEMMKHKPWTTASLREVGGTEGVGLAFLEGTFGDANAPPQHRYHQQAAREVLRAMLPDSGTNIKGHMRSRAELLATSGYAKRPRDFDELIGILDGVLRLITPTDPDGQVGAEDAGPEDEPRPMYYQLTHDYLIPSLREWLTLKEKQTRRGRAELMLADRAAVWTARPENRQLPSLTQWVGLRVYTRRRKWTEPQRKMMRRAARHHLARVSAILLLLACSILIGLEIRGWSKAQALAASLRTADTATVPGLVAEMPEFRRWLDPLLRRALAESAPGSKQRLHASLGLLPVDPGQVDFLGEQLLRATPGDLPVLRDALAPHRETLLERLWAAAEAPSGAKGARRLPAASALAAYDPMSPRWGRAGAAVVDELLLENPIFLGLWSEALDPARGWLTPRLAEVFRDRRPDRAAERNLATNLLADYAAERPEVLAGLLMDADTRQFATLYPKVEAQAEGATPWLTAEIDRDLFTLPDDDARERRASRQANAAVALLRLGRPGPIWVLLKHSPDPRARSNLIHRLRPLGADPAAIVLRLDDETDLTSRRALLQTLGEFPEADFRPGVREALMTKAKQVYEESPDAGLHASAGWLLRTWGQRAWLEEVDRRRAGERAAREQAAREALAAAGATARPGWFVNGQGQTMVAIAGPVVFTMGSPATEASREAEPQHARRIGRTFALAARQVTLGEYRRSVPGYIGGFRSDFRRSEDLPVVELNWNMAAAYCNWLSDREGIARDQWCYEVKDGVATTRPGHLRLAGYRLPTEAEMEFATRAGASTARPHGESDELLANYSWHQKSSAEKTWPVGSLKPNDFGLFDALGNTFVWCQDTFRDYPAAVGVVEDEAVVVGPDGPSTVRVLRGASFNIRTSNVRSAARNWSVTVDIDNTIGLRPARTLAVHPE